MEKHFHIDIETTGIDPHTEELMQIGVLEVDFVEGFWRPNRSLEIIQRTKRKPESDFAREHMHELYRRCNEAPYHKPQDIRSTLLEFFAVCGALSPNVYLMGWNASNFDVPFLVHNGCLRPTRYEKGGDGKDILVGDFHYRIYEIAGAIGLVQNVLKLERKEAIGAAERMLPPFALPSGLAAKDHDALYDCYKQTHLLNGLIAMMARK
jgi:hypothetical protein